MASDVPGGGDRDDERAVGEADATRDPREGDGRPPSLDEEQPTGTQPRREPDPQLLETMAPFTADRRPKRDPEARLRLATVGCLLAAAALMVVLSASQALFSRWVSTTVLQTRKAIETRLPPSERRQVADQLDRFFGTIDGRSDRDELSGAFMRRAREVLNDGRVSHEEAEALSAWLASVTESEEGGRGRR